MEMNHWISKFGNFGFIDRRPLRETDMEHAPPRTPTRTPAAPHQKSARRVK